MSKFFQSENVRSEMEDIMDLQRELYKVIAQFPLMSDEAKWHHIETIKELLEKQQIMWTRITLSDDPEAKKMKEDIRQSATIMGLPANVDMNIIFGQMSQMVDVMRKQLDIL